MEYLVLNIDQFVDDGRRQEVSRSKSRIVRILGTTFPCAGRFLGNYILMLYLVTKIIYIVNTLVQISMISDFLDQSIMKFGFNVLQSLIEGKGWFLSNPKYFPSMFIIVNNL